MLPTVDFCGLTVTRLIIGANPFGGYSHQNASRDQEMREYYTQDRITETWAQAETAGINTFITNNETPQVLEAVRKYLGDGGALQWIAQLNPGGRANMAEAIRETVAIGCTAGYFHGALIDDLYARRDEATLREWCDEVRSHGIPVGAAGHIPEAHTWVDSLGVVDFHAVCCFNCGSVHDGAGEKFRLGDLPVAMETIRAIHKPCIAYKIMGAGRIEARMAFDYAFQNIKPGDVVNVGMYRGDSDGMVAENAGIVGEMLG